jgi:hypothetical protein
MIMNVSGAEITSYLEIINLLLIPLKKSNLIEITHTII